MLPEEANASLFPRLSKFRKLVFKRCGYTYVLKSVWVDGSNTGTAWKHGSPVHR